MSELYEKSLLKLELDLVLQQLAECAGSAGGKEACLRVRPSSDLEDVELMLQQTTAASDLCTRKGNPIFGDVTDVSASLERADRGGSLQPVELLRIAGVLRCARNIKSYESEDEKANILDELFRAFDITGAAQNAGNAQKLLRLEAAAPLCPLQSGGGVL